MQARCQKPAAANVSRSNDENPGGKVPWPTGVVPSGNRGGFTLEKAPWQEGRPAQKPSPVLPVARRTKLAVFLLLINYRLLKLKACYQKCVLSCRVVAIAGSKRVGSRNHTGTERSRTASVDGFSTGGAAVPSLASECRALCGKSAAVTTEKGAKYRENCEDLVNERKESKMLAEPGRIPVKGADWKLTVISPAFLRPAAFASRRAALRAVSHC